MKLNTRIFIVSFCVLLGIACSFFFARKDPQRSDIIIITVDTLRADRLGAYGYAKAKTPHIDSLAKRGTLFTQASTPLPRTTPALASLLTGLSPNHHGSTEVAQPIDDVALLSEYLKRLGYSTLAVSSTPVASPKMNMARGFDRFIVHQSKHSDAVTRIALTEIDKLPVNKPKFIWIHYRDPHTPYIPPFTWSKHVKDQECFDLVRKFNKGELTGGLIHSNYLNLAKQALNSCSQLYDAEIAYQDFEIGKLFSGVEKNIDLNKAVIILTSDHGENLGEDDLYYEHGPSLHNASLQVPLVIAGPGIKSKVDNQIIRLQDIVPTLLGLLDLPKDSWPTKIDGFDFSARLGSWNWLLGAKDLQFTVAESGSALSPLNTIYLHSGRADDRYCLNHEDFSLCTLPSEEPKLFNQEEDPFLKKDVSRKHPLIKEELLKGSKRWPPEESRQYAVLSKRFKLVVRPIFKGGYKTMLYDLESDPAEQKDVKKQHPELVDKMKIVFDSWFRSKRDYISAKRSTDQLEALRSLGYIQ